jgi:hypothetical protein
MADTFFNGLIEIGIKAKLLPFAGRKYKKGWKGKKDFKVYFQNGNNPGRLE